MVVTKLGLLGMFLVAFAISAGTSPLAIRIAPKIGAMDVPKDNRRMHKKAMPRFGGMAIFLGTEIAMGIFLFNQPKIYAVMIGGAFPHRLGLSETVLVFDHHMKFLGGFDEFVRRIPEFRSRCIEKKLFVEATADQARVLVEGGVDGIQFDKMPAAELPALVEELRTINPHVTLIAAGGINPANAAEYAATGVDGLATTALFTAKPLDMSVRMTAL